MAVSALRDELGRARDAFRAHAWQVAFDLFSACDREVPLGAEDLLCLADAAYWSGRPEVSLAVTERAHGACLVRGDNAGAALAALFLYLDHRTRSESSLATGWLRRAERLLEGQPECSAHGFLAHARVALALSRGDLDSALAEARRMVELGARLGIPDLETLGLERVGHVLVASGDAAAGLAMLDEAVVTAVSGELGLTATAMIYCSAIAACRDLGDYRRAREWSEAATRWCEREATTGFPGLCRVYHAEILRRQGKWQAAEEHVRRACQELASFGVLAMAAAAQYELGEIRRLVGDLEGAEAAYRQALEWGHEPQPGLALLWAERGELDAAFGAIRRALADLRPQPDRAEAAWQESRDPLAVARLLPALVEVSVACGQLEQAREACAELDAVAQQYGTPSLKAQAAYARAVLAMAEGKFAVAQEAASLSQSYWKELDSPYETARSRMLLASARHAAGDQRTARLELEAAQSALERLGARLDAARAKQLLRRFAGGSIPDVANVLTAREVQVLQLVAEGLTDTEISERLVISQHTVHRHLANVRTKLGQPSRAAAISQATRLGLL